jgi:hypothetical protein
MPIMRPDFWEHLGIVYGLRNCTVKRMAKFYSQPNQLGFVPFFGLSNFNVRLWGEFENQILAFK